MSRSHLPDRTAPKLVQAFLRRRQLRLLKVLGLAIGKLVDEIITRVDESSTPEVALLILVLLFHQLLLLILHLALILILLILVGHKVITCHLLLLPFDDTI